MSTMTRTTLTGLASLGLLLGASACNELERLDDGGSGEAAIPDEVQRVFDDGCAIAGCHDANSRQAGLDLTAGAAAGIIGGSATQSSLPMVTLGDVQGSYLAHKLLPESEIRQGDRMPVGRDFNDAQVALDNAIILGWIAGAELPGGGDDSATGDSGGEEEGQATTAAEVVACGVSDVAPMATNPFDIGTAAGQIPEDIGAALTNNCGCHGPASEEFAEGVSGYFGQLNFSTIAEFQGDFMGRPAYEVVLERVQSTEFSRMPPSYYCVLEDGEPITAADQQLLIDWLTAGAPDAATWDPAAG